MWWRCWLTGHGHSEQQLRLCRQHHERRAVHLVQPRVSDSLPLGLTFVSATAGGKATNNVVVWPVVKALSLGAVTNYILTVRSTNPGLFTNTASALAVTYDSNLTNNTSAAGRNERHKHSTSGKPGQLCGDRKHDEHFKSAGE